MREINKTTAGADVVDERIGVLTAQAVLVTRMIARRAIRSGFSDKDVPFDVIEQIVECGLHAPSSKNAQPWKLHIVRNHELLQNISVQIVRAKSDRKFVPQDLLSGKPREDLQETVDESAHVLSQASLGIFIENEGSFSINRRTVAETAFDRREDAIFGFGLEYIGLGACIENMWLAAEDLGLRGVFMGDAAIAEGAIKERLSMSGDFVGVLALGYSEDPSHMKHMREDRVIWH